MEKRQKPLKIRVGCEFTIFKMKDGHDDMINFLTTNIYEEKITPAKHPNSNIMTKEYGSGYGSYMDPTYCGVAKGSSRSYAVRHHEQVLLQAVLGLVCERIKRIWWCVHFFQKP